MRHKQWLAIGCSWLVGACCFIGCQPPKTEFEKKPRPVEVKRLTLSNAKKSALTAAPVASWKTEQIGFEVSGRILSVIEPNEDVKARLIDKDNVIFQGTEIAKIDDERYRLQVESQQAQVLRAEQAIKAAEVQRDQTIPAQIDAAKAEVRRADTEYKRSLRLVNQNAGAQSDVDRDKAAWETAKSQLAQYVASKEANVAELKSLSAQLAQAKDSLGEAKRNLNNCTLYSSFDGQIADVAVVPGSVVAAGAPVATVQMMDPIKVEVEVSDKTSRRMRNRQQIPVVINKEDGESETVKGYLYLVDPVADPQTRTFTLTLLVENRRLTDEAQAMGIPSTSIVWRVNFAFLPGRNENKYFVSEDAIYEDQDGFFVWHVTNVVVEGDFPVDRVLNVRKARIKKGPTKVPFLGNWIFQQVEFDDDQFDPETNVVAGKLKFGIEENEDEEALRTKRNQWDGDKLLYQNEGQWLLRPGDLVKVDLSDNTNSTGYFVPIDSIGYELEETFIFLLDESDNTVERVNVRMMRDEATETVVAIEPIDTSISLEGRRYVSRGAHYLIDGENVRPVESEEGQ